MTVRGAANLIGKLQRLPASLQVGISDALEISAAEMHGHAGKRIQQGTSGGRVYKRGKRSHTASRPGEYPNSDTGALVSSLRWEMRNRLTAIWGAYIAYAKSLEFGTSRMAARPFMRPTYRKYEARAKDRVRKAVNDALRRSSNG